MAEEYDHFEFFHVRTTFLADKIHFTNDCYIGDLKATVDMDVAPEKVDVSSPIFGTLGRRLFVNLVIDTTAELQMFEYHKNKDTGSGEVRTNHSATAAWLKLHPRLD